MIEISRLGKGIPMSVVDANGYRRNLREWAADCQARAGFDIEPEAQDAFRQMAEEFEFAASEIDGLVSTFEALIKRKRTLS
jgi:hypothetical protein